MSANEVLKTCGACLYARMTDAKDLTQMICRAAPPSVIALPHPQGVQVRAFYPPVAVDDEGCGMHRARLMVGEPLTSSTSVSALAINASRKDN